MNFFTGHKLLTLFLLCLLFGCRTVPKIITPVEEVATAYTEVSMEELKSQALKGDHWAMLVLGYRYEKGIETPEDEELAAEWYMFSAKKRNVEATYRLALIYANPNASLYNFKSGKAWLRRAARMGHNKAKVKLHAYPPRPSQIKTESAQQK